MPVARISGPGHSIAAQATATGAPITYTFAPHVRLIADRIGGAVLSVGATEGVTVKLIGREYAASVSA